MFCGMAGATSAATCTSCEAGKYSADAGMMHIRASVPTTFTPRLQHTHASCSPGKYSASWIDCFSACKSDQGDREGEKDSEKGKKGREWGEEG